MFSEYTNTSRLLTPNPVMYSYFNITREETPAPMETLRAPAQPKRVVRFIWAMSLSSGSKLYSLPSMRDKLIVLLQGDTQFRRR